MFQQDGTLEHCHSMQQFFDMSWSGVWLLCSLDLSAFDYDIWGVLPPLPTQARTIWGNQLAGKEPPE
jgi:hypothetical protein